MRDKFQLLTHSLSKKSYSRQIKKKRNIRYAMFSSCDCRTFTKFHNKILFTKEQVDIRGIRFFQSERIISYPRFVNTGFRVAAMANYYLSADPNARGLID